MQKTEKELILEHLGILVTTYCNLNCRDCADLIPKREHRHYEPDNIKSDLSIVLANVDYIEEVLVIGGETLVYPWLPEVLDFCEAQKKIGKLIITTNGSIIPDDNLLENFKKNNVLIRISGYPEYIVPNREETLQKYKSGGLEIEDLENMQWCDIGDFKHRHRTEEEIKNVFRTCAMKNCVCINPDGKIFFCSRQMTADETTLYPSPLENEFVNIRTEKDIRKKLQEFYELPYITTCDYCDGISCATEKAVPAALQILKKDSFLDFLSLYSELATHEYSDLEKAAVATRLLQNINDHIHQLHGFESVMRIIELSGDSSHLSGNWNMLMYHFLCLLNELTKDYDYDIRIDSPYARTQTGKDVNSINRITVSDHADPTADLLIEEQEVVDAVNQKWPIDLYVYNRLFINSKLEKLKTEPVECIVCGLSYTQYGLLENEMPVITCNLSVTGQDIPYSILMAERALEYNPNIGTVVIPMAYYQCCYDMSADSAQLHKDVVSYINMPILGKCRNYTGEMHFYREQTVMEIYNQVYDLEKVREDRDKLIMSHLTNENFFNAMFPQPLYGGLKFDFKALSEEENFSSAYITAQHNERVCTLDGYKETIKYLVNFLTKTEEKGIKVLFFVPPATRYLTASTCIELKNFYYQNIVPKISEFKRTQFLDLFDNKTFDENDFSDFEHLNYSGAKKLTKIIGKALVQ